MKKILKKIVMQLFERLLQSHQSFYENLDLTSIKGVEVLGVIEVYGRPIIDVRNGGRIILGSNVVLNSENKGYHLNMHSPVKLFVDREKAVIKVGSNTRIHGSCIHAYDSIVIGSNCLIAANCQIIDGSGHDLCFDNVTNRANTSGEAKPICIADNVWVGANCIILPGVSIGEGSVISAGSVVIKNIPKMVLAGGIPAKVIKNFNESVK